MLLWGQKEPQLPAVAMLALDFSPKQILTCYCHVLGECNRETDSMAIAGSANQSWSYDTFFSYINTLSKYGELFSSLV